MEGDTRPMKATSRLPFKRLLLVAALCVGLLSIGLATWPPGFVQASGTVTDCSSPYGPDGFYTKLGFGGLVTFNCPFPGPTLITIGEITPAGNTTVDGTNNGHPIVLSGGGTTRLFHHLAAGNYLTLTHITLRDGNAGNDHGGCIFNDGGTVVLIDVTVTHCRVTSPYQGGGIYNGGNARLYDSTLSGNSAGSGGGIYNYGAATLNDSIISGNSVTNSGGGMYNFGGAILTYSTLSGNSAANGGGIYNPVSLYTSPSPRDS
jgi:hypothetical protein